MAVYQEWFTVQEAAEYLRVSKRVIYQLCKEGRLIGYRAGDRRHRRFRREELDRALEPDKPEDEADNLIELTALTDPVLAEVWDNERDAAYDRV